MLREQADEAWRARRACTVVDEAVRVADRGLVLGAGTVLLAAEAGEEPDERRFEALLITAHRRRPDLVALTHIRKAALRWRQGEPERAVMHLALGGVSRLRRPQEDARRLFLADALLQSGLTPDALVKALDLESAPADGLRKYSPDQPRVPAGSGRPSGQWTTDGAAPAGPATPNSATAKPASRSGPAAASKRPEVAASKPRAASASGAIPERPVSASATSSTASRPKPAATAASIAAADAAIDLGALSGASLDSLARFLGGLRVLGAAAATPLALGFGFALIPTTSLATGKWVKVGGPSDVSYLQPPDETDLHIQFTAPSGERTSITADWDPGKQGYRDRTGKIVARLVGSVVVVSTAALGLDSDDPQLCPAQVVEPSSERGRKYEDFVKHYVNPAHPTPSGMVYAYPNFVSGRIVKIDDCERETGFPVEAKGPGFEEHMLKDDPPWQGMYAKMVNQAYSQVQAAAGRPLTWYFDEESVADRMRADFHRRGLKIDVVWLPMGPS